MSAFDLNLNKADAMKAAPFFVIPVLILAGLFAIIQLENANNAVFVWVNTRAQVLGDTFWECVTVLGDGAIVALLVAPFVAKRTRVALSALIGGLIVLAGVQGCKFLIGGLPRPVLIIPREQMHYSGLYIAMNSFPSGHSAMAFMLAGVLSWYYKEWPIRIALVSAASLVAISRVAVGAHWPVDILGGSILGWIAGGLGYLIARSVRHGEHRLTRLLFQFILLGCAISIFFYDVTRYPEAYWFVRAIALVSIGVVLIGLYRELKRPPRTQK